MNYVSNRENQLSEQSQSKGYTFYDQVYVLDETTSEHRR